jgi:hypothetical protein
MSIENFIPEVTSADLETAYQAAQVVIPTLNRDHEGEAKKGNAVKIVGAATPTIVDYAAAGRKIDAEALADTEVTVLIDQEKAFAFKVDDIDAVQAAGSLDPYTTAAGGALAEEAEEFAVAMLLEGGTSINVVGSAPVKIDTGAKAKKALQAIRTAFAKAKVPTADRFVAVNPAFADLLLDELSDASKSGSDAELRNGQVGRLYGMTILETPAFAEAVKPVAVGYHSKAASFISQIDKTEAIRSSDSFADVVRGLNVYGGKVTRTAGVVVYLSEGTPAAA